MKGYKTFRHTDPSRMYSRDPERDKRIIRLAGQGYGKRQITRMVGCSRQTVDKVYLMHGLDASSNSTQKLTDDDIQKKLGNGWEYVGGYTGYYGNITIRCTKCGNEKKILWRSVSQMGECSCIKAERKARKETEKVLAFWDELQKPRPLDHIGVVKTCRHCGKPFVAELDSSIYCSAKCRDRHHHTTRDKRIRDVAGKDDISLDALIKRDGLTCWICGEPCDLEDAFWKDGVFVAGNNYPSVDHVFPLSKGGTHTWDNVRIAHRLCNILKSDKMPPSLENRSETGS